MIFILYNYLIALEKTIVSTMLTILDRWFNS